MRIVCGLDVHKDSIFLCIVPPERIQQLRLYDLYDLDDDTIRKLAKLDAAVQRCNIRLSNYVSNTDSVSYKSVIDKENIIASLKGCVTEADIDIMAQLKAEIDMAEAHKQKCMDKMQEICEKEVVVAISRKMLVCAWHILREGVGYKDFDNMIFTTVTKG